MLRFDTRELERGIKRLQDNMRSVSGEHRVAFSELFNGRFMRKHTRFGSFEELLSESPFEVDSAEDFAKIPDAPWDSYIRETTTFACWADMLEAASAEWARAQAVKGLK